MLKNAQLLELREALRRRSKAIGYGDRGWSCERIDTEEPESLLVRVGRIDFRLWSDGIIWVHADMGRTRVEFNVVAGLVPATEIVSAIEASLSPGEEQDLLALWARFQPYDVQSRS